MDNECLLSVIIPVYNGEAFLASTVESVLRQQVSSLEILLIDDGSTDSTAAVAEQLQTSSKGIVRYVVQQNAGPSAARNRGLDLARGEFIAFLDADDLWPEKSLNTRLKVLQSDPTLDVVMGRVRLLAETETNEEEASENSVFTGSSLGSGLFRKSIFETVGVFDPSLRSSEDVDWFLRAREKSVSLGQLDDVTLLYRRHEASITYQKSTADLQILKVLKRSLDRRRHAAS
jgi:glycosyltransferase involved in cell wall biosynthesis